MGPLELYFRDLVIRKKIFFLTLLMTLSLSAIISITLTEAARSTLHRALQSRLKHVAATAAMLVEGDQLDRIRTEADREGSSWKAVSDKLVAIADANKLRDAYVMRRSAKAGHTEFVVDPSTTSSTKVGQDYDASKAPALLEAFEKPGVDADIVTDEFGATLSGYAPIRRSDGSVAGIVGLDMDASDVLRLRREFIGLAAGITSTFMLLSLLVSVFFARMLERPIVEMRDRLQQLTSGRLEVRMPDVSHDEIGQLSQAINRMIDTLSHYLPVKLVGQILGSTSDLKLGGNRMPVTAYFSDIAGFTSISEKLSPEEIVALLNEYLTAMSDLIEASEGTVDKYEGDAIVAYWGAPLPLADHARLACEAALRQMEAIEPLREKWKREGKPEVSFRIGLNSGDVIAGNMGSNHRFNYTIMGDVVNLASRLEGANKLYGSRIMMGESTYELVRGAFECRKLDRIRVVGKKIAVSVYELIGRKGEAPAELLSARDEYEKGLNAYVAQRWDDAKIYFAEAGRRRPKDAAAELFLKRIAALRASPPAPGWDGTHDLLAK